ncbi:hypothetical protein H4582DRAFT_1819834 [Lactarius indigo]|nr:hypothetical protein H4582DRAFT_1819834 [Lactarius indigo]
MDEELRGELETDEFNAEIECELELEHENANEPPTDEPVVDDSGQRQHCATTPPIDTCDPHTERHLRVGPHVVSYPDTAGRPVCPVSEKAALTDQERYLDSLGDQTNPYAPFKSRTDWEIAQWAKMRGPSSSAFTDLVGIDRVVDKLGLSFKNSMELNKIIDTQLPGRPSFKRMGVELGGEVFDVYFRDIMECVRALYSDPEFSPYLVYAPERHYVDEKCDLRMYHDMHTGEWWWSTQKALDRDAGAGKTIIPIILSSDKTQITLFRNKSAYPLYMTIGNIPKEIRRRPSSRAYVLVAYLPTSRLPHIASKASCRRCLINLYHACLSEILSPIIKPGRNGVTMASADGISRRCHPIYACFIGDYPEQVLVTCTKTGECAQCPEPRDKLGDTGPEIPTGWRDLHTLLDALHNFDDDPAAFFESCKELGVKPVTEPFWKDLPYAHVYRSITPDILHQLYQGVMKHAIHWTTEIFGAAEIDARCRRLPPNHNTRLFLKGISSLSRVSGTEHGQICRFLLALVLNIPLPDRLDSGALVRALRKLLDFLYLTQYPVHTTETLQKMDAALQSFHDNKHIFVSLGIRDNFNIPKLHFAKHYCRSIKLFGTTDNFNTEYTERLHIDLAKDAYAATNHKDEFPQMALWLERKEKMVRHTKYIQWRLDGCPAPKSVNWVPPGLDHRRILKMAIRPTVASAPIDRLEESYGAIHFRAAIGRYVAGLTHTGLTYSQLEDEANDVHLSIRRFLVWHNIKYLREDPWTGKLVTADIIHCHPERQNKKDQLIPARHDIVLINSGTGVEAGVKDRRIGQVRVVFSLPESECARLFPSGQSIPKHLAYVEWFTSFSREPEHNSGLHKISRCFLPDGTKPASIIPVINIFRSVHLYPKFGRVAPASWTSSNVLEMCKTFYLNPFTDRHLYRDLS